MTKPAANYTWALVIGSMIDLFLMCSNIQVKADRKKLVR